MYHHPATQEQERLAVPILPRWEHWAEAGGEIDKPIEPGM